MSWGGCGAMSATMLKWLAVYCSVLQCVAVPGRRRDAGCCIVLQGVAVCCSMLQGVAVLQYVAVYCGTKSATVLQYAAVCCSVLPCIAVYHSAFHCEALPRHGPCCSVLQCAAAYSSVLQWSQCVMQ